MLESRIVAVDHVNLEAPVATEEEMRWFYGEVALLDEVHASSTVDRLVFKSARIELRIRLRDHPKVEAIDCRVAILVPSLPGTVDLLDDRKVPYDSLSGLRWTDRRLSLLDPGGNRVEFHQYWPRISL